MGIGIPDGRFVVQGDVGVGMLKWQTSVSPLDKGGEGREWGDSARAGICELWLDDWYYTNCAFGLYELPPSFRFPPLREGNRRVLVPPASRGNLKEGVINCCFL